MHPCLNHPSFLFHPLTWTDKFNYMLVLQKSPKPLFQKPHMTVKCKTPHLFLKCWQKEECTLSLRRETWSIFLIVEPLTKPSPPWKVSLSDKYLFLRLLIPLDCTELVLKVHRRTVPPRPLSTDSIVSVNSRHSQLVTSGFPLITRHSGGKERHRRHRTVWIQQLSVPNEQKIFLNLCTSPPRQAEVNKQQPEVHFSGWMTFLLLRALPCPKYSLSESHGNVLSCLCDDSRGLITCFSVLGLLTQQMLHEHPWQPTAHFHSQTLFQVEMTLLANTLDYNISLCLRTTQQFTWTFFDEF